MRYILSGDGAGAIFEIDATTGDIHATKSLDRERKSQYVLHARAIDRWTNRSLEAESEFIIKVQDVNDNAPTFPDGSFSATVPEMSDVGKAQSQHTCLAVVSVSINTFTIINQLWQALYLTGIQDIRSRYLPNLSC